MISEQKQRLKEVEENRRVWHGNMGQVTRDIDFLLSLVKSQEAGTESFYCEHCEHDFTKNAHVTDDGYWLCETCWRGLDSEEEVGEMAGLYTDASVVVDNLSKDLSALRSENVLMRAVVDAAKAYTIEFKTGMTDAALQKLAVAVNAYNDGRADETGRPPDSMPPVLWVGSNNQGGCFDARRHRQCSDDCRYLLSSQADASYTDALRDAARRERDAAASMRSACVEKVKLMRDENRRNYEYWKSISSNSDTDFGVLKWAAWEGEDERVIAALESLSIEQPKE